VPQQWGLKKRLVMMMMAIKGLSHLKSYLMSILYLVQTVIAQSKAHQTIHFGVCNALISRALALISNYK
jgi:membrane protein required for beta-lactamase induction